MAIGNHTFWLVVDLDTRKALTPESDLRHALRFDSEEAAQRYADEWAKPYVVIRVPA